MRPTWCCYCSMLDSLSRDIVIDSKSLRTFESKMKLNAAPKQQVKSELSGPAARTTCKTVYELPIGYPFSLAVLSIA